MKDNTINPWKIRAERVAYKNPWITIRECDVIRPDGKPGIYGIVDTRIATGVIAVTPENEIFLVGQYRLPVNVYSWEIIEGGSDSGESPMEAAKRELHEEAGITAALWQQLGGEVHLSNCHSSEVGYFFIAEHLTYSEATPDETELLAIKKVPFKSALVMVDSGEIQDAMSIIAILRASRHPRFQ